MSVWLYNFRLEGSFFLWRVGATTNKFASCPIPDFPSNGVPLFSLSPMVDYRTSCILLLSLTEMCIWFKCPLCSQSTASRSWMSKSSRILFFLQNIPIANHNSMQFSSCRMNVFSPHKSSIRGLYIWCSIKFGLCSANTNSLESGQSQQWTKAMQCSWLWFMIFTYN